MSKREAISILIRHAASNVAGAGQGIRSLPSDAEKQRVIEAIRVVWSSAYNYPCSDGDLRNLGLNP